MYLLLLVLVLPQQQLDTKQRDALHYFQPHKESVNRWMRKVEVPTPFRMPVGEEDNCGACITNSIIQYVTPDPHYTTLEWRQPKLTNCNGWNIEQSTDTIHWIHYIMLWRRQNTNTTRREIVFTTNNPVFWRVAAY